VRFRRTVEQPTRCLTGIGLHSGLSSSVRILPSESGGIIFKAKSTGQEIAARCDNVRDTRRCTMLASGDAVVQTVEHVLSALSGMGVTDAVIEYEGEELPALDGSSAPYVDALMEVGLLDSALEIVPITIQEPLTVVLGESVTVAIPSEHPWLAVTLEYPSCTEISSLSASWHGWRDYASLIAPARTFGFVSELEVLRKNGLGLGVTEHNVVALADSGAVDARTPLRFTDELARHKLLDLIGDLCLCGRPLIAGIVAFRPSHTTNTMLAARLSKLAEH